MRHEIVLAPSAAQELRASRADFRSKVADAPQYRLRIDGISYDIQDGVVEVLAIVTKAQAQQWLDAAGVPAETGGTGGDEG